MFRAMLMDALRESMDRRTFWVMTGITLLVMASLLTISFRPNEVSMLFGIWVQTLDEVGLAFADPKAVAQLMIMGLLDLFLNTIGMILMLIGTASMFPDFQEPGRIDILLGKPISRLRLFLYRYAACMMFVAIQAAMFVGLLILVAGLRWGVWLPRILIAIPLAVLLFSYCFCVSALIGTKLRSTTAAILISLAAWFAFSMPDTIREMGASRQLGEAKTANAIVEKVAWALPKTGDIPYLAQRFSRTGVLVQHMAMNEGSPSEDPLEMDPAKLRRLEESRLHADPFYSIGSSLAFEAILVALAAWVFIKRDF